MAITVKHKFVSAIPDAGDTTIVQPSNWNDDHQLVGTVPVSNGGTGASTLTGYVKGTGTSAMTAATTIPNTDITGLGTASTKDAGVANGVATLDSSGTVPLSQIPALGDLNYQGTWNATTNSPTLTSSVGTKGFYYVVSVAGTTNLNGITDWQVGDWAVYNGSAWQKIDNTDAVTSVNGYTGTVVLTAADVSAVPYTGATTAVDLNAKSLTNVSNLGINTTTVPTIKIRAIGDNNSSSRIAMRGYSSDANSSAIRVTKFRGTAGAPQAPQSGDSLGKFELAGYGTTSSEGYPQASLEGLATEAWGATARGTKAVIKVTPNTTTTQVTALTINQDSTAVFANTVTANGVLLTGNTGTVTSVAAAAGTGISVSGSPITTSGTLTITNTAPDQTVALTAGTGISTSGTYPNFTITNTAPSSGGTVTSVAATVPSFLSVAGSPITTSGTLALTYSGTALPVLNGGTGVTTSTGTGDNVLSTRPTMSVTGAGFTLQDATDNTKQANFDLGTWIPTGTTYTYQLPNVNSSRLATLGNISQIFTGSVTFSNTVNADGTFQLGATTNTINLGYAQTSGTLFVGNTAGTGTITVGRSTVSQTTNIQAGATASASTKTINLGTGGLTGSTTTMAIGSTFGTAVTANGVWTYSGANAYGTPASITLTNATGLPVSTGISGLGTGVVTALGVNTGTAGAFVVNGGALGTPSSGVVTNLTGTASININGTVGATTANTVTGTTITATKYVGVSGGTF